MKRILLATLLSGILFGQSRVSMPADSSATLPSSDVPSATNGKAFGVYSLPAGPYIMLDAARSFSGVAEGTSKSTFPDSSGNGLNFTCTGKVTLLGANRGFWMAQQAYATASATTQTTLNGGCTNTSVSVAPNNFTLAFIGQMSESDNGSSASSGGGQSSWFEMLSSGNWLPALYSVFGSGSMQMNANWQGSIGVNQIYDTSTSGGAGFWKHDGPQAFVMQFASGSVTTYISRGRSYTFSATLPSTAATTINLAGSTTFANASQSMLVNVLGVWKRQWTAAERANFFNYANSVYGVPQSQVHALLVTIGDSITAGRYAYAAQSYPQQLAGIYNAFPYMEIRNIGVGNARTQHWMLTSETSGANTGTGAYRNTTVSSDPMLSQYDNIGVGNAVSPRIAAVMLGTADCLNSVAFADAYGSIKIIGTDLRAKGFTTIIMTPPHLPTGDARQTCVANLAAAMQADAGSYPASWGDAFVDIYTANPTIGSDSIHPTNAGYRTIAQALAPKVMSALSPSGTQMTWNGVTMTWNGVTMAWLNSPVGTTMTWNGVTMTWNGVTMTWH